MAVQVAMSGARKAAILLLTLGEDPSSEVCKHLREEEIEAIIIRLNRDVGLTVVLVEQNVSFARQASHCFAMMEKGRVVVSGAISELSDDMVHRHMAV